MKRTAIAAIVPLVLVGTVGGAVALGIFGTPAVTSVDNRFTGVSTNTTTVETGLAVNNPNPVGVQLGGTSIEYTVFMNDVAMANGSKEGLTVAQGNSTLQFTTEMDNSRIPDWWVSHIDNGETTQVTIDANVSSSLAGGRSISLSQNRTVETDIIGQFNSEETRPVNTDNPVVTDPALYINETRGSWDQSNLTGAETPIDIEFDVHNPKSYPYTVTEIGYTAEMNDVTVGTGATESAIIIEPSATETVGVDTVIQNENLDEWWVSHLRNNQVTDLYIDFYVVVEAAGEEFRLDLEAIDYENTIETDIFDNKAEYPTGEGTTNGTAEGGETGTTTSDGTVDGIVTEDGVIDADDGTLETDNGTETGTATDDGAIDDTL